MQKQKSGSDRPTRLTVGGRTYEILSVLLGDRSVMGHIMVARAKNMSAHNGKEEREHLLKHQDEIPASLRNDAIFVFTNDLHNDDPRDVCCVYFDFADSIQSWVSGWSSFDRGNYGANYWLLRRIS